MSHFQASLHQVPEPGSALRHGRRLRVLLGRRTSYHRGNAQGAFRWREAEAALTSGFVAESLRDIRLSPKNLVEDLFADAAYRSHLAAVLARRAVAPRRRPRSRRRGAVARLARCRPARVLPGLSCVRDRLRALGARPCLCHGQFAPAGSASAATAAVSDSAAHTPIAATNPVLNAGAEPLPGRGERGDDDRDPERSAEKTQHVEGAGRLTDLAPRPRPGPRSGRQASPSKRRRRRR